MNKHSAAGRRYLKRFVPTMTAYVLALFGATYALKTYQLTGIALVALSILPALPIIGVIGVIALYIAEETDEFLRQRVMVSMMIGLAIMLSLASAWGFLEESDLVPHLPAYWAFIVWCASWGASQCAMSLRDRLAGDRA